MREVFEKKAFMFNTSSVYIFALELLVAYTQVNKVEGK